MGRLLGQEIGALWIGLKRTEGAHSEKKSSMKQEVGPPSAKSASTWIVDFWASRTVKNVLFIIYKTPFYVILLQQSKLIKTFPLLLIAQHA